MLIKDHTSTKHEDPRITRTRGLLVKAFNDLMHEKSFETITIGEITERATLNRVTFYAHFEDKFALLAYAMNTLINAQIASQLGTPSFYSEENLKKLILLVCSFLTDIEHSCPPPHGQMEPLMEKQIKQTLSELLLSWIKQPANRIASSTTTADQAATVAAWSIYGAAQQWSQHAKQVRPEDFVKQIFPLIKVTLAPFFSKQTPPKFEKAAAGRAPNALFASPIRFQLSY